MTTTTKENVTARNSPAQDAQTSHPMPDQRISANVAPEKENGKRKRKRNEGTILTAPTYCLLPLPPASP